VRSLKVLLTYLLLAATLSATDWRMYLGDLLHSSNNPAETQLNSANIPQLQPLWKINTGNTISSAVTLSNGSLYFGDWSGNFYAVNAASGATLWKTFVGKAPSPSNPDCMPGIGVSSQPVADADTVYVGGGDSMVYALNRNTGEIRWRVPLADANNGGYLWSSVMLSGNALYIGIASLGDCPLIQGGLARIPLDNPSHPLIRRLVPDATIGASVWSTPAIDEAANLVYVTTGNAVNQDADTGEWGSALLALDAATLTVKAHFFLPILPTEDDADWGSSPTLFQTADGQEYVAANGKNGIMYVLSRPDLTLAWQSTLAVDCDSPEQGCGSISTPAFDGNSIVTGAGQSAVDVATPGTVRAIDAVTRNPLWVYPARGMVLSPVTLTPGLVFVPTSQGLAVLDSASGAELWTDGTTNALYSQAAVADGTVYCTYANGDVVAYGVAVGGQASTLVATPNAATFAFTNGGTLPAPQPLNVYASTGFLNFAAQSDSPWLTVDVQTAATPTVINLQADVSGLAPGTYQGKIALTAPGGVPPLTIPVQLVVNGSIPAIAAASVTNAASFQPGPLAPGSLFTIFAGNLAQQSNSPAGDPWPTTLSGLSVKINGIAAPIAFVGPTQVNAQVPFELAPGPAFLVLESNGAVADPVPVTIAATTPGVFLLGMQAAALNQDGTINGSSTPAPTGSVVAVYFTGQGQVDHPPDTGTAASSQTLSNTLAHTSATIGGLPAIVSFSGLAPGFIGLAQANVQVPDLDPGDYPLVLTIGEIPSNVGTITIRPPR
jgi:uncharacterized protein (TIGR03437 family)